MTTENFFVVDSSDDTWLVKRGRTYGENSDF